MCTSHFEEGGGADPSYNKNIGLKIICNRIGNLLDGILMTLLSLDITTFKFARKLASKASLISGATPGR